MTSLFVLIFSGYFLTRLLSLVDDFPQTQDYPWWTWTGTQGFRQTFVNIKRHLDLSDPFQSASALSV